MGKILKLRGEIIVIAIISVIIASVSVMFLSCLFNANIDKINYDSVKEKQSNEVIRIVDNYKSGGLSDKDLISIINEWSSSNTNLYLVNHNGDVLASREKGIKNIKLDEINDKEISELNGKNVFEICDSINIDDDKTVVYYCTYYPNDSKIFLYVLVITLISFFILIQGRIAYIRKMNNDITSMACGNLSKRIPIKYKNELSELAESINQMTTNLQEEDNKKREFITNISHDLRTPLTTMLGYLKMIEESKYEDKEELNKYISIISKKGIYLRSLLDDFFTYSKLGSRDINVNKSVIDVQLFLEQIVDEEKTDFKENDLELILQDVDKKYYINADSELMARAIYNLLSNARKYSKEKTKIKVTMTEESYNNKLYGIISVINTPRKILDQEGLDMLFERLYKREEGRSSEGSGLGLTIAKEIMELHEGLIKGQVIDKKVEFKLAFLTI